MASTPSHTHFSSIPWCADILSAPRTTILVPWSRNPKPTTEDSLIATTLSSRPTIPYALTFYLEPSSSSSTASGPTTSSGPQSPPQIDSISTLFSLGEGLDGHPRILHGGIVATLLDEVMGFLLWINHIRTKETRGRLQRQGQSQGQGEGAGCWIEGDVDLFGAFTAELSVRYKKPVVTPGTVLVRTWFERQEGRKKWIKGVVEQRVGVGEGGGKGKVDARGKVETVVCAEASALFIEPRPAKL